MTSEMPCVVTTPVVSSEEQSLMQGQRTLDFVLKSKGFIDKTLLIDIELLKVV